MGLVQCPDCGKDVSTEAASCPGCGRPMRPAQAPEPAPVGGSGSVGPQHQPAPVIVETVKNRGLFIILGVFLGYFGIHNFYAGYNGKGAAQLIVTILLGWLVIGFIITWLWALVEVFTVRQDARGNPMV